MLRITSIARRFLNNRNKQMLSARETRFVFRSILSNQACLGVLLNNRLISKSSIICEECLLSGRQHETWWKQLMIDACTRHAPSYCSLVLKEVSDTVGWASQCIFVSGSDPRRRQDVGRRVYPWSSWSRVLRNHNGLVQVDMAIPFQESEWEGCWKMVFVVPAVAADVTWTNGVSRSIASTRNDLVLA